VSRILFVDDEPRVLEGLENMLFDQLDAWEMAFVTSGRAALAACDRQPFDVVVTDMRMPGMDGAALLAEVRQRWPETVRIVLSGQTDPEQTERALTLTHDLIGKPATEGQLVKTIQRALALQRSCRSDALRRVAGHLEGLPARPNAYSRLQAALTGDDPIDEGAAVIEGDPALVAGLLRVVSSAFFAAVRPIDRVRDAIVRLGLDHTAALVLALCAYEELAGDAASLAEAVFSHCSTVARHVRRVAPPEVRQKAFLAALLHDVGFLVTAGYFSGVTPRLENGRLVCEEPLVAEEREILGFDHGHAGAYLLRLWNIDEDIAEAIEHHHDPTELPPERRGVVLPLCAVERALLELGDDADDTKVRELARAMITAGGPS